MLKINSVFPQSSIVQFTLHKQHLWNIRNSIYIHLMGSILLISLLLGFPKLTKNNYLIATSQDSSSQSISADLATIKETMAKTTTQARD